MSFTRKVLYPCNPGTVRGASTKLSSHGDKVIYTNGRVVIVRHSFRLGSTSVYLWLWARRYKVHDLKVIDQCATIETLSFTRL